MPNPDEETYVKTWLCDHFKDIHFDVRFGVNDFYKEGPMTITFVGGPSRDTVHSYLKAMGLRREALNIIRRDKPE